MDFTAMKTNRREFFRKSVLFTGAAGLQRLTASNRTVPQNQEGDRLVLLGTQGGPFIRSYKQTPSAMAK
jgi:hypothetical protein